VAGVGLLMGSSGGQRFAQLLNSGLKSASLARVILVPSRQSGHLSVESLQPRDGFDDDADACGWTNAGHKLRNSGKLRFSLGARKGTVKCRPMDSLQLNVRSCDLRTPPRTVK
jgi:hypothetical protein